MAYYGPISLILLPAWWLVLLALGFGGSSGPSGARRRAMSPGSSLLTLGFLRPPTPFGEIIAFVEAAIGLALVALLISYLPTIYSAFSRRELLVNLLEVRADSPPSPVVMITRMHRLHGLDALHDLWERWEQWFAEVEETHSSLPVLVFYRSQQPDHSWVNAAGAVMDSAALMRSSVATPWDVQADLAIRSGYPASAGSRPTSGFLSRRLRSADASMIAGLSELEISLELRGSGTMSRLMPKDATCSLSRVRPSTDQASSILAHGSLLQMLVTPIRSHGAKDGIRIAMLGADLHACRLARAGLEREEGWPPLWLSRRLQPLRRQRWHRQTVA